MNEITSRQNAKIKDIYSLKSKKGRDLHGKFIVESVKFVDEIKNGFNVDFYVISKSFLDNNNIEKYEKVAEIILVSDHVFEYLSDTVNPQGILAVIYKKHVDFKDTILKDNSLIIVCENLSDPGNVGTIIRTADATGACCVLFTKSTVDIYSNKVIRATAGSFFNISIYDNIDLEILDYLKENDFNVYAAHLKGEDLFYTLDLTKKSVILIGNEGNGLTDEITEYADKLVRIPIIGKAESLNASIACGVFLYEAVRQRI